VREKKKEVDGDHFCILSLLALFDLPYFLGLATAASATALKPPSLQPVADSAGDRLNDRQAAMCASSLCNAHIESSAAKLLLLLPELNQNTVAADFIRGTVSRPRCGCAVVTPCESSLAKADLIVDNGGAQALADKACDANGVLSACGRTWVNCENVPPPACAKPCNGGNLAVVNFRLQNLNWTCVTTNTGDALKTLRTDVIDNVPGLLDTDFSCECSASASPNTGTECKCTVACMSLATVQHLNLDGALTKLQKHATGGAVATAALDKAVKTCKLTKDNLSFGSSFVLTGVENNFPKAPPNSEKSASSTLVMGFSAAVVSLFSTLFL